MAVLSEAYRFLGRIGALPGRTSWYDSAGRLPRARTPRCVEIDRVSSDRKCCGGAYLVYAERFLRAGALRGVRRGGRDRGNLTSAGQVRAVRNTAAKTEAYLSVDRTGGPHEAERRLGWAGLFPRRCRVGAQSNGVVSEQRQN